MGKQPGKREDKIMSWGPISVGDGRPSHHIFTTDSGVFSLAGVANNQIVMHMGDIGNNYALYVCTGTWNITDSPNGKADFTPSAADISTGSLGKVGLYKTYPVVTLSTGPVPMDAQVLQVVSLP
jgi:hypothetical protein